MCFKLTPAARAAEIARLRLVAGQAQLLIKKHEADEFEWDYRRKQLWTEYYDNRLTVFRVDHGNADDRYRAKEKAAQASAAFAALVAMKCPDALRHLQKTRHATADRPVKAAIPFPKPNPAGTHGNH